MTLFQFLRKLKKISNNPDYIWFITGSHGIRCNHKSFGQSYDMCPITANYTADTGNYRYTSEAKTIGVVIYGMSVTDVIDIMDAADYPNSMITDGRVGKLRKILIKILKLSWRKRNVQN